MDTQKRNFWNIPLDNRVKPCKLSFVIRWVWPQGRPETPFRFAMHGEVLEPVGGEK